MKHIFNQTFTKMFTKVITLLIVLSNILIGYVLSSEYKGVIQRMPTFDYLSSRMAVLFALLSFVIVSGLVLWIVASNTSSGLFASELHEGTMRLILSKPISRSELVIGKVGAMMAGSMVYLVISFAVLLGSFCLFAFPDMDITLHLLKYAFVMLFYGLFMTLFVGSVGSFLSTCFKKKVPALLILVSIGFLVFGVIPIIRLMAGEAYLKYHLYYFDMNYHFGLIFNLFISPFGQVTTSASQLEMFTAFTNIYTRVPLDRDIVLGTMGMYQVNHTINQTFIVSIYSILTAILYGLTYQRMKVKDIS